MGHRYPVQALAFSPDGRRLASSAAFEARDDAEVKLWDVITGRALLTLPATGWSGPGGLAFTPDGHRLSVISMVGPNRIATVQVWDATPVAGPDR